ncbi:putative small auxin-up RNA [Medicago truncatula]|uniref:Putative small auxin-up RNA n=1 Tax=Medicago truncatula TaxID=3880 RepID=G7L3U4_MEDTR|nr:indole-3-acetic acid-induced protein ARG7 [Medicago truncatula]AES81883.1 SAUR-like auxin-responsive family protein [Medicago truncatula]RHN48497.1 putative small auxin-up RNA [Medicago truncatula]
MKCKFLRGCVNKLKKMTRPCDYWFGLLSSVFEMDSIPNDVPKGHLVVYVGENYKRFVIKIGLLHHPLFKALLEQAREEYDFIADSKLCIPCNEHLFLSVLSFASSTHNEKVFVCV